MTTKSYCYFAALCESRRGVNQRPYSLHRVNHMREYRQLQGFVLKVDVCRTVQAIYNVDEWWTLIVQRLCYEWPSATSNGKFN